METSVIYEQVLKGGRLLSFGCIY